MAAAAMTAANRRVVSLILHHLSDMKYKDRRQRGPDQPVEFLEFRPTLVPSILVNKLWAEEGTSILWKRYPHLPALQAMAPDRRQWYANKVERLFVLGPPPESEADWAYLEGMQWPKLKILELEVDWKRHEQRVRTMLHAGLEHLEFLAPQSGSSQYIAGSVLPALFAPCANLRTIHFGPDALDHQDPVHSQELIELLESSQSIVDVRVINTGFIGKDTLFRRLSQRPGLEALEIDLEPGLQLLPSLSGTITLPSPFASLRRLHLMCYPEIALALPVHLRLVEHVQIDMARIPNQLRHESDMRVLDDILSELAQCPELRSLRVNVGQLALDFPSAVSRPSLSGMALVKLASGCHNLQEFHLLASEPAAIDGSMVSSRHFDAFCRNLPHLKSLSLKLHPQTAFDLESTALRSLGRYCARLETLRLKVSLQLPSLQLHRVAPPEPPTADHVLFQDLVGADGALQSLSIAINGCQPEASYGVENYASSTSSTTSTEPCFQHLVHLAFARPQSILSIASDTYTISSNSQSSSIVDPLVEEDLVKLWAESLSSHFPRLEVLEAWSDWTGQDNESLSYFLPLEESLASMWEFLSGVEQDLWEDARDFDEPYIEIMSRDGYREERFSFDSHTTGDDWEMASLINEFPVEEDADGSAYLEPYHDEPEGMITPGGMLGNDKEGFFQHADPKHTKASTAEPEADDLHAINDGKLSSSRTT
ncbi:hypothetical protein EJ02DRAFT_388195 [Clathrospora elynae]|uniref:Uncharacterized protein n=1 Tax=Clathrospora elynae TaxID=706981 RepID=A0A6A5S927_9PLEO|nr:hypothetical protein EJ02DRAFT_388195 [Clathrospora elynae]